VAPARRLAQALAQGRAGRARRERRAGGLRRHGRPDMIAARSAQIGRTHAGVPGGPSPLLGRFPARARFPDPMAQAASRMLVARIVVAAPALVIGVGLSGPVSANGFSLPVQDSLQVGRANAGTVADAADASTVFHNPAGMTELAGEQILGGATAIYAGYDVADRGSTATTPATGGAPVLVPGENGHPRTFALVPTLFYARPMTPSRRFWVGLSLTSPWGLGVEYDDDWFGRYDSIETRLTTVNLSPAMAYRITEWLSIGGGLNLEYADVKLAFALPDTLAPGGPTPATDGMAKLTGDDIAVGFNVGVLIKPWSHTRVGLHYRSPIRHEFSGKLKVSNLTGALAGGNGRVDADFDVHEPDVAAIGIAHEPIAGTTLFAEAQWFNWSRFKELRATFDDGQPDNVRPQDWKDTWSFYGGIEQRLFESWTLRAGAGYEPTPTVDEFRNTSLPDGDRVRLGLGVSYDWSDRLRVDVGYAYVVSARESIDLTPTFFEGTPGEGSVNVRGRANLVINDFALRVSYRF
jgi:long-chain fatty acid transport protein